MKGRLVLTASLVPLSGTYGCLSLFNERGFRVFELPEKAKVTIRGGHPLPVVFREGKDYSLDRSLGQVSLLSPWPNQTLETMTWQLEQQAPRSEQVRADRASARAAANTLRSLQKSEGPIFFKASGLYERSLATLLDHYDELTKGLPE